MKMYEREGLKFERSVHGDVRISWDGRAVTIPANEWLSIIHQVSNGTAYAAFEALHQIPRQQP